MWNNLNGWEIPTWER